MLVSIGNHSLFDPLERRKGDLGWVNGCLCDERRGRDSFVRYVKSFVSSDLLPLFFVSCL